MERAGATALLVFCAGLASASSWVRTKPDRLRGGAGTDGTPLCLVPELRKYAHRMPWDFAPSRDNPINCGAGGGESSNYVLATDPSQPYEMHVVSVLEGSFPVMTGDPTAPEQSVQVVVYKTRKPAVLVLAARDPVLWDVTVTPEARLELVILQGKAGQVLRGVPDDVPVVKRSWEQACAYAHAWEPRRNLAGPDAGLMLASLRCATGLRESSFQGCQAGAVFEVPHYRQEGVPKEPVRWEPPCPLPVDPDVPLVRRRKPAKAPEVAELPRPPAAAKPAPPKSEPPPAPPPAAPARPALTDPAATLGGAPESLPPPVGAQAPEPGLDERAIYREAVEKRGAGGRRPAPPRGEAETLPAPKAPAGRADIPVRALSILMKGDKTLLTHDAVPDLVVALEKGDETLRWRAADALGQLGGDAAKAVEPLLEALRSESWRVRSSAALALGNIGAEPKRVVKRLRKLIKDRHPDVRDSAKTALIRLGVAI